jgi:hypothetical protein
MRRIVCLAGACLALTAALRLARAQDSVAPPQPLESLRTSAELDQLLAPIALYPDPMLALMLPAAGQPVEVVLADRYVTGGGDPTLIGQQPWSASVQALARYPAELEKMNDDLAWTTELGQAFIDQPQDVMESIQRLRAQASAVGTLQSTPQEQVSNDGGDVEIVPTDPSVYYTPIYDAATAYEMNSPISFGDGRPVGSWFKQDIDWGNKQIIVWNNDHPRPANWWRQPAQRQTPGEAPRNVWSPPAQAPSAMARRLDRGYQSPGEQAVLAELNSGAPRKGSSATLSRPGPAARPAQAMPRQQAEPARAVEQPSGALIGVESAQITRQYSSRGEQSSRAAAPPPSRPAAPPAQAGRRR